MRVRGSGEEELRDAVRRVTRGWPLTRRPQQPLPAAPPPPNGRSGATPSTPAPRQRRRTILDRKAIGFTPARCRHLPSSYPTEEVRPGARQQLALSLLPSGRQQHAGASRDEVEQEGGGSDRVAERCKETLPQKRS